MSEALSVEVPYGAPPLVVAQHWARLGFPAFPVVVSKGEHGLRKQPAVESGFRAATTDPDKLSRLFDLAVFPGQVLCVGIVPGPAGFVIYDVDVKAGDGLELADRLGIPADVVTTTPSGGQHRWCRKPDPDVSIGNASPWPNIDIRADDGFVMAPGSQTPWGEWVLLSDLSDVPEAPADCWAPLRASREHGVIDLPTEVAPETGQMVEHLTRLGAKVTKVSGGVIHLSRPGVDHTSGTVGALGPGVLYSFSPSWGIPCHEALLLRGELLLTRDQAATWDRDRWVAQAQPTSSWLPRHDLPALLRNPHTERPTVLRRIDGHCLFYAGKVNVLFGQSEAGKSWVALEAVRQVLLDGGRCLYADLEDSVATVAERMQALGMDLAPYADTKHFGYVNPSEPLTPSVVAGWDVIVIDSANELLTLNAEASINDNAWITAQYRVLRAIAGMHGACVILIDHATNKADAGTTLGASAKKNAVNGTEVLVVNEVPLARGQHGMSVLYITKDRSNGVEGIVVRPKATKHTKRSWALMTMPDTITTYFHQEVKLEEPALEQRTERSAADERAQLITLELEVRGELTIHELAAVLDTSQPTVSRTVTRMALDGLLTTRKEGTATYVSLPKPQPPEGMVEA